MKLSFFYWILYSILFATSVVNGAKILGIYPLAAKSHFTCNHAILKSLIEAGHQVTVITPFPQQASEANYTSIIDVSEDTFIYVSQSSYQEFSSSSVYQLINVTIENEKTGCYNVMNLPEIRKILNSDEKLYDVVFVEILFLYKCYLRIAEKMKVPVIGTVTLKSWLTADYAVGNPSNPSHIPPALDSSWQTDNFYGRARNLWNYVVVKLTYDYEIMSLLKRFHQDHIDILGQRDEFLDIEPDLLFYNNHPSFLPRPMNPNVIEVAGIQVKPANALPKVSAGHTYIVHIRIRL